MKQTKSMTQALSMEYDISMYKKKPFYSFIKRFADIVFSLTFMIVFSWLYVILYLIVKFGGPLSEKICKYIFHKIILGVKALHEAKIYHRDLKLDNIIIDDNINPKICDLDMYIYQQGKLKDQLDTKYYMPPNKLEGKEYLGDKADIYSL